MLETHRRERETPVWPAERLPLQLGEVDELIAPTPERVDRKNNRACQETFRVDSQIEIFGEPRYSL
jgi:hypothetical protein